MVDSGFLTAHFYFGHLIIRDVLLHACTRPGSVGLIEWWLGYLLARERIKGRARSILLIGKSKPELAPAHFTALVYRELVEHKNALGHLPGT